MGAKKGYKPLGQASQELHFFTLLIYYTPDPTRIHDNYIMLGERNKSLIIKIGHSAENCQANNFASKLK